MEVVIEVPNENYQKAREILLKDDMVSRASIVFKEGKEFGIDGYIIYVSGLDEQCKRAIELLKDLGKTVEENKKSEIIKKMKEDEERAIEGFGGILG